MGTGILVVRVVGDEDSADDTLHPTPSDQPNGLVLRQQDGTNVRQFPATSVEVQHWTGEKWKSAEYVRDVNATCSITDTRLAVMCSKYDKGGGWIGGVSALALNAGSKALAAYRRSGKCLTAQVRYAWISHVGGSSKSGMLDDEQLVVRFKVTIDGHSIQLRLILTLPKNLDSHGLAAEIARRAATYRLAAGEHLLDQADEAPLRALATAAPLADVKGRFATHTFPGSWPVGPNSADLPALVQQRLAASTTGQPEPDGATPAAEGRDAESESATHRSTGQVAPAVVTAAMAPQPAGLDEPESPAVLPEDSSPTSDLQEDEAPELPPEHFLIDAGDRADEAPEPNADGGVEQDLAGPFPPPPPDAPMQDPGPPPAAGAHQDAPQDAPAPPSTTRRPRFCTSCGSPVEGWAFCTTCGRPVRSTSPAPPLEAVSVEAAPPTPPILPSVPPPPPLPGTPPAPPSPTAPPASEELGITAGSEGVGGQPRTSPRNGPRAALALVALLVIISAGALAWVNLANRDSSAATAATSTDEPSGSAEGSSAAREPSALPSLTSASPEPSTLPVVTSVDVEEVANVGSAARNVVADPTGSSLYITDPPGDRVLVVDRTTLSVDRELAALSPNSISIAPDGSTLVLAQGSAGTVRVIDLSTESFFDVVVGTRAGGVTVAPNGKDAYVCLTEEDAVARIDLASGIAAAKIPVGDGPTSVRVTSDGSRLLVTNSSGGSITVVDADTTALEGTITVGGTPRGLQATSDGRLAVTRNSGEDTVSLLDLAAMREVARIPVGAKPTALEILPGDVTLLVANSDDGTISLIDLESWAITDTEWVGGTPAGLAFDPDANSLYVVSQDPSTVTVASVG